MIKIEITNPHEMTEREIHNMCTYLYACVGQVVAKAPDAPQRGRAGDLTAGDLIDGQRLIAAKRDEQGLSKDVFMDMVDTPSAPPVPEYLANTGAANPSLPSGMIATPVELVLDAKGYPYDGRIHSREATRVKDGTWKLKRGVEMEEVIRIRNEYMAAQLAPVPAAVSMTPAAPVTNVPPPPPAVPATGVPLDFPAMITLVSEAFNKHRVTQADVLSIVTELGLPTLPMLQTRPDLLPHFHSRFMALLNKAVAA
jgi:hypothetical protein